ncbi:hypothetical protein PMI16_02476 [Herbaspirillum sp. CF444]|uniref:hypothetical protein n=1 Tax=Herbaspirillum sp. CF444 TaxID=1144319 RepID=UPI0002724025|nr:hypothetical protein [Herbaspirillum sp. CF444]EJL88299.1 hypothetical protein PMI16_02476 [Herbaspirillum sp. CF444]
MKILAFAPHSAIWVHAFPEALVLESLRQHGHEILYITCGEKLNGYCIPMSAVGLTCESSASDKKSICDRCNTNARLLQDGFGFRGPDIASLVHDSDQSQITAIMETLTKENYIEFAIDDVPVGRYALYEFLINHKKDSIKFSDFEWRRFQPELKNALYAFFACRRLLDEEKPDRVAVYNAYYSVNHICCALAEQRNIPHYYLHAGNNLSNRLQTISVSRGYGFATWNRNPHWETYKKLPCSKESLSSVTNHVLELLHGTSVFTYSASATRGSIDLRKYFGVRPSEKILIATMSSTDERVAAEAIGVQFPDEGCIFPTQFEWIEALIKHFGGRFDTRLIIRVHPRNFPNKREGVKSAQAVKLEKLLVDLPDNICVNWPSDNISMYHLADIADVILNGWSNAGKEMSLLGLPVVLYSHELVTSYPASINYVGDTLKTYFSEIERAISDGWSFENIRNAYRWCAFEYYRSLFDISESFPAPAPLSADFLSRLKRRVIRGFFPNQRAMRDIANRAPFLKEGKIINDLVSKGGTSVFDVISPQSPTEILFEQETAFLIAEIKRIYDVLYGGEGREVCGGLGLKLKTLLDNNAVT